MPVIAVVKARRDIVARRAGGSVLYCSSSKFPAWGVAVGVGPFLGQGQCVKITVARSTSLSKPCRCVKNISLKNGIRLYRHFHTFRHLA